MTGTKTKLRSLFLATVMVLSVFGGTIAFAGSAAAAGNSSGFPGELPQGVNDNTPNSTTTLGATSTIADVSFDTPGNVSNVTVNATGGDEGDVTASSIDSVTVSLYNGTNESATASANYDSHSQTVDFGGNVTGVDNITIHADLSGSVTDGEVIDTNFTVATNPSGWVDTVATQNITTETGYFSGRVSDQNNNDVEGATVVVENSSTGFEKTTTANDQGEYTIAVPAGSYTVYADAPGFEAASPKDGVVEVNSTTTANFVLTRIINADDISIIEEDNVAVADGTDQVSYTVEVTTNDTTEGDNVPISGVNVDVTDNSNGEITWTSPTVTTDDNGTATFTGYSNTVNESDVTFTDDQGNTAETTATFRPEEGDATLSGSVENNETEDIEGATVWVAYEGENQTLSYAQENQPWLIDTTVEDGDYTIEGIVADAWPSGSNVTVYVMASGYNAENMTDADVSAWVAAADNETVYADDTKTHNFVVHPGGPSQEYQLDVTVDDGQKTTEIAEGTQVTATVTVEQRQEGSSVAWDPAPNQDVTVELTDNLPLDPNTANVTTDSNGEAQLTFVGVNAGATNITASTENADGDVYNTTGSEQANVSVYGSAEITGDVVNEDDENLLPGQATVELFVFNTSTSEYDSTGMTSEIGAGGSYVFTNVRSGEKYRMVATTDAGLTGQATTVDSVPSGTTTNDIVVVGAAPTPAAFQVSDLNPMNVTVTQGDEITVSATIENTGLVDATKTVEFRVGSTVVASQNVSLAAGANTTVTFENVSTAGLAPGDYTHGVYTPDDSQTATLTVEGSGDGDVVDQYDTNDEAGIQFDELTAAAQDYSADNLTFPELVQVAQAYSSGQA